MSPGALAEGSVAGFGSVARALEVECEERKVPVEASPPLKHRRIQK